MFTGSP
ncbi:hypothetical protein YPPY101_2430, partial [Yersinia pestis PY-101]